MSECVLSEIGQLDDVLADDSISNILNNSRLLVSKEELYLAFDNAAFDLTLKFKDKNPIFMCVMNGGLMFTSELLKRLKFPLQLDYVHATRYGNKTTPGETLYWKKYPSIDLSGRNIVLVDDVLDGGVTFSRIKDYCLKQGAKSVNTVVMVNKQVKREPLGLDKADFSCVSVGGEYIFGFGLDYKGYWRNLENIYAVNI